MLLYYIIMSYFAMRAPVFANSSQALHHAVAYILYINVLLSLYLFVLCFIWMLHLFICLFLDTLGRFSAYFLFARLIIELWLLMGPKCGPWLMGPKCVTNRGVSRNHNITSRINLYIIISCYYYLLILGTISIINTEEPRM